MRIEDAKMVLDYAADIQKKLRTIAAEKDLLEGDLNCLRGIEYGGMPHGSGHSDSTADIAQRAEELGSLDRLRELEVQEVVLRGDFAAIRAQIWSLKTVYTTVISELWLCGHSSEETAHKIGYSVSHTKRIKAEALVRLAESLDDVRVRIMRVSKAHQLRECKRYAPEGVKENVKAFHLRAYDIKAN